MARPGLTKHPKFKRLMHDLGMQRALAWGTLECLWEPAYESGDPIIGDVVDVELAADWQGEKGLLVKALLACGGKKSGFIELVPGTTDRYQIHELHVHAPDYVANRFKKEQTRKSARHCEHCGAPFRSAEPHAKFCSKQCRQNHNYAAQKGDNSTKSDAVSTQSDGGLSSSDAHSTQSDAPPAPAPTPAPLNTDTVPPPAAEGARAESGTAKKKKAAIDVAAVLPFYDAYPRKKNRPAAILAIANTRDRLAKRGEPPKGSPSWDQWLLGRVKAYADHRAAEVGAGRSAVQYTPHPATWFNAESYDEAPDESPTQDASSTDPYHVPDLTEEEADRMMREAGLIHDEGDHA